MRIKIIFVMMCLMIMSPIAVFADERDMRNQEYADYSATVEVNDPLEPMNRVVYRFNSALDAVIFRPVAKTYRSVVPEFGRRSIRNALLNLLEPITMVNSLLQGDIKNSFDALFRFTLNTSFGIGGLFDVAKDAGLERRYEDFGQTLGVWGAGHGPYLVLPILGPSGGRDVIGVVADAFSDPFNYIVDNNTMIARYVVEGIDKREALLDILDDIERESLDPYASLRSMYVQRRLDEINNGK